MDRTAFHAASRRALQRALQNGRLYGMEEGARTFLAREKKGLFLLERSPSLSSGESRRSNQHRFSPFPLGWRGKAPG